MTLWEGELVDGQNGVAIVVGPWEWDGGRDAFGQVMQWIGSASGLKVVTKLLPKLPAQRTSPVVEFTQIALDPLAPLGAGGTVFSAKPPVLVLDYKTAEVWLSNDFGAGRGVLRLRFQDDPKFAGIYEVFVQIEQLP